MQKSEAIEAARQSLQTDMIMSGLDLLRVLAAAPIQSRQLQRRPNDGMD